MKNIRYILSGVNEHGERREIAVKEYPDDFTKNYFEDLYSIKIVKVYKAKLKFLESEEI